jgi:tripartite ATP-independent transporter DctM subunit
MNIEYITLIMFGSLILCFALGVPIAVTTGGLAVVFTLLFRGPSGLTNVALAVSASMSNYVMIAIPMFVFMAAVLESSGLTDGLFNAINVWVGNIRGGIAIAVLVAATIMAAMVGVVGASVVSMTIVALPAMLKYKYDRGIALGSICAGGALGILIPPSILFVFYGIMAAESIGKLFMGGVFPGLLLSGLYIAYVAIRANLQHDLCPLPPPEERNISFKAKFMATRGIILPAILIVAVLGSIYAGVASITEAAGVGALGAIVCAIVNRKFNWTNLKKASFSTMGTTAMVLWILFGATAFVNVYQALGGPQFIKDIMLSLPLGRWEILILTQVMLIILGMFIDPFGIVLLTVPIFLPVISALGFDKLWFAILFNVNMQIALISPPFGGALFFLKGTRRDIPMSDIFRAAFPFCGLQLLGLTLCIVFPQICLWLPNNMIK